MIIFRAFILLLVLILHSYAEEPVIQPVEIVSNTTDGFIPIQRQKVSIHLINTET